MRITVLIVDDDALIRQLLSLILRSSGYSVVEAFNGKDAMDKLAETSVDLVVTDLRMPELDGIEFTRKIRMDSAYRCLPVIMLTSDFQGYKRLEGEQVGVNSWISKPFIPQQLIRTIRELVPAGHPGELICNQAS